MASQAHDGEASQLAQQQRSAADAAQQWDKLRSALPVAAVWTALALLVHILLFVVLAAKIPSSVLVFLSYGRARPPYFRMAASDLAVAAWIFLAIVAVIIAVSFLFRRRRANWPLVVGLGLSILVPWFLSSELLSVLFQLGLTAPAGSISGGTQALIFISNIVFAIVGTASVFVFSRRRSVRG